MKMMKKQIKKVKQINVSILLRKAKQINRTETIEKRERGIS